MISEFGRLGEETNLKFEVNLDDKVRLSQKGEEGKGGVKKHKYCLSESPVTEALLKLVQVRCPPLWGHPV